MAPSFLRTPRVGGQTVEIRGNLARLPDPCFLVARIAEHYCLPLEARERRNRVADGRAQMQRGKGAGRDLPVDRYEPIDRAQAQDPDARKDDDHEGRCQKHFRC